MTSDREAWRLRGPVRELRSEFAEVDLLTGDWEPPKRVHRITFNREGNVASSETQPPPGVMPPPGLTLPLGVAGVDASYSAPGAVVLNTRVDEHDRPVEHVFLDANRDVVRRLVLTRDERGRVVREDFSMDGLPAEFARDESVTPADLQQIREEFARVLAPGLVFSSSRYVYDGNDHVVSRQIVMGNGMSDERSSYEYDEYGNRILEVTATTDFQTGELVTVRQHTRFEFSYDHRGNWTERIVWTRTEPTTHFHRSYIERRGITYFDE